MRARNIKPGFWENEDLGEMSIAGRQLFIGLWCLADREGRLEDRPRKIKGNLFRFDGEIPVEELLADRAKRPLKRFLIWCSCRGLLARCVVQRLFNFFRLRSA